MAETTLTLNIEVVRRRHQEIAAQVSNGVAEATRDEARENAPEQSGELKDGIEIVAEATPEQPEAVLESQAAHSAPVNFGHHTESGSFVAADPFFTSALENAPHKLAEMNPKLDQ